MTTDGPAGDELRMLRQLELVATTGGAGLTAADVAALWLYHVRLLTRAAREQHELNRAALSNSQTAAHAVQILTLDHGDMLASVGDALERIAAEIDAGQLARARTGLTETTDAIREYVGGQRRQ